METDWSIGELLGGGVRGAGSVLGVGGRKRENFSNSDPFSSGRQSETEREMGRGKLPRRQELLWVSLVVEIVDLTVT